MNHSLCRKIVLHHFRQRPKPVIELRDECVDLSLVAQVGDLAAEFALRLRHFLAQHGHDGPGAHDCLGPRPPHLSPHIALERLLPQRGELSPGRHRGAGERGDRLERGHDSQLRVPDAGEPFRRAQRGFGRFRQVDGDENPPDVGTRVARDEQRHVDRARRVMRRAAAEPPLEHRVALAAHHHQPRALRGRRVGEYVARAAEPHVHLRRLGHPLPAQRRRDLRSRARDKGLPQLLEIRRRADLGSGEPRFRYGVYQVAGRARGPRQAAAEHRRPGGLRITTARVDAEAQFEDVQGLVVDRQVQAARAGFREVVGVVVRPVRHDVRGEGRVAVGVVAPDFAAQRELVGVEVGVGVGPARAACRAQARCGRRARHLR